MKCVVTGGGGFLGGAIVRALLKRDHEVASISRSFYPELADLGVRCLRGDLAVRDEMMHAFEGADVVFHVAAKAGVWGPREEYVRANVTATRNVVDACLEHDVKRLVYTSSPSVCFDGKDHVRVSNNVPHASTFLTAYPETKAEAEAYVLFSNGRRELATCALRPHLIFGPGDPHILPRLIDRARKKRLAIIGDGKNEVSLTFVENAAEAHMCAARGLNLDAPHAGKAYFIGQREPVQLWDWINDLLTRLDIPPVKKRLSLKTARALGATLETVWRTLKLPGEPPMTRFVATQLATSHSYDMTPAERDFGYEEKVGMEEAMERTVAAFRAE